ncbi:glycosyltransferase family 2 protein [Clostridium perfringens]|uniref:glycosyltransferase family 2 protein n=1 Tax=Clostridium perfringens TaxID=1502 RepID=UPI0009931C1A|nr:glycosyltransferase family A protein [Clostridium perfringens]AQW22835.1 hypothetical protein BXT91_02590 [Clostridium perfringens]MBI6105656.1 glycosyltransferase family 2 protein [Clostridium perfringens]MBO3322741.1 glycosyltransferase family 2 protein [Clostridium perfringens]MBO3331850.1 glycosyltransferase family 2 protein [Clostridium perfringens]MBO3411011.1 glycosyltransferase family 2 protein [Clostridium perfringens]
MPTLSIVIPIYNSEKNIGDCIKSILQQSFTNYEIILVNDGSTDQSEEICKLLMKKDYRVKYVKQINHGVSFARNKGIEVATGEYLMFMDSDDLMPKETLKAFFDTNDDIDFILGGYSEFVNSPTQIVKACICHPMNGSIKELCSNIQSYLDPPLLLGPCFKRFKRSIINEMESWFPLDMSYGEDAVFVLNYLMKVKSVKCIDVNGYLYRKSNHQSLSGRFRSDKIDINIELSKKIEQLLIKNKVDNSGYIYELNCVRFFDSYTTELILSNLEYNQSKKIFREKAYAYDIKQKYDKMPSLSTLQKIRRYSVSSDIWFAVMYLLYDIKKIMRKVQ